MWLLDPYFLLPSGWNCLKQIFEKIVCRKNVPIICLALILFTCFLNALNSPSRLLCCWLETVNILSFYLLAYCEPWHWSATFFCLGWFQTASRLKKWRIRMIIDYCCKELKIFRCWQIIQKSLSNKNSIRRKTHRFFFMF